MSAALDKLWGSQPSARGGGAVQIGEFCEVRAGYGFPPRLQGRGTGEFPFYKVSDMTLTGNERSMVRANHWIDADDLASLRARPFLPGTVIFPKVGAAIATNKKRLTTRPCLVDNNVMGITPDPALCLAEYLHFWMCQFNLSSIAASGPLPSITAAAVRAVKVPLPSLNEQRRVARILSTIQRASRAANSSLDALAHVRSALVAEALATESTRPLQSLIDRPQYGYTASASNSPGPRFLRITDLQDGGVDWTAVPGCDTPPQDDRYVLSHGDLVVARIGATTGKAWLVCNPPPAVFASYLIRIRAAHGCDPRFLGAFFESHAYWAQINAAKGGRLKGGVNIENLNALEVPVLRIAEQRRLGDQLDALAAAAATRRTKRDAVRRVFESTLSTLFARYT